MKRITFIAISFLTLLSCQKQIIERRMDGTLSLQLDNSPVVEMVTKADETAVSADEFDVYVRSEDATFSYIYKDMPAVITVPVGLYTVSAENITETESLTLPDAWGQIRYAGITSPQEVVAGLSPTQFSLTCTMVNTAVSVVFDESISKHFTDYSITAYTTESRKLVYDVTNTSGENPAVGYFIPDAELNYVFSGIYDGEPVTMTGSKPIVPASHLYLTFRMSEQNGAVFRPEIIVDASCEDLYETITVDPTQDNASVTE